MKKIKVRSRRQRRHMFFKRVALMVTSLCIIIGSTVCLDCNEADAHDSCHKYYKSIQIEAGESLWTIANEYKADNETSESYIESIKEMNQMDTNAIHAGDYITIYYFS